jgi:predicted small lipoprotein YifL
MSRSKFFRAAAIAIAVATLAACGIKGPLKLPPPPEATPPAPATAPAKPADPPSPSITQPAADAATPK